MKCLDPIHLLHHGLCKTVRNNLCASQEIAQMKCFAVSHKMVSDTHAVSEQLILLKINNNTCAYSVLCNTEH